MKRIAFLFAGLVLLALQTDGQDLKSIHKKMRLIEGGTFIMGGGYQYEIIGPYMHYLGTDSLVEAKNKQGLLIGEVPEPNNPDAQVTVSSYYLAETEVTNKEYRVFLVDSLLGDAGAADFWNKIHQLAKKDGDVRGEWDKVFALAIENKLMPDTMCWETDFEFAFNKPMVDHYFQHYAFDEYPVLGVSWVQANAYCEWLSRENNEELKAKGKPLQPNFRLPTEAEWEYAARGQVDPRSHEMERRLYPWEGIRMWNDKGMFRANVKADHGNYFDDGYMYTAPVKTYAPNEFGLYNMAGNVAEWTLDVFRLRDFFNDFPVDYKIIDGAMLPEERVAKGGSWADYRYAAQVGSRCSFDPEKGHSRVGFRIAQLKISDSASEW